MPKAIEDIKNTILIEAKRQVLENGYSHMTLRSIAEKCNIAVGTIYNYFSSKEMLTASFMLADWMKVLKEMEEKCKMANSATDVFSAIYNQLKMYHESFLPLFKDAGTAKSYMSASRSRHMQLRSQISEIVSKYCGKYFIDDNAFTSEFIAEAILAWTIEGKDFKDINEMLNKFVK